MKSKLKYHYALIRQRGLITVKTTMDQFVLKMEEEWIEVLGAYADDLKAEQSPSDAMVHEMTDMIMTIMNTMTHLGIDFETELDKNIAIQENRVKNLLK